MRVESAVPRVGKSLEFSSELQNASRSRARELCERLLAAILLLLLLPLILVLAALVVLTSRGPAIYRQVRVGWNGRPFTIYKLRTMRVDAEAGTGAVWATPGDSRSTPIGQILRKTHLDELLQLINIIKGEMAFVGPRPERPEFVGQLSKTIPHYEQRLEVLPGLTGLAQLQLEPDQTIECVRKKVEIDLQYIDTQSLSLDLRICCGTALLLFGVSRHQCLFMVGLAGAVSREISLDQASPYLLPIPVTSDHRPVVLETMYSQGEKDDERR